MLHFNIWLKQLIISFVTRKGNEQNILTIVYHLSWGQLGVTDIMGGGGVPVPQHVWAGQETASTFSKWEGGKMGWGGGGRRGRREELVTLLPWFKLIIFLFSLTFFFFFFAIAEGHGSPQCIVFTSPLSLFCLSCPWVLLKGWSH